ncbi:hypothetical protein HOY33_01360 [Brenneria sp. hezel4-2-4]|nr:hypothetical protein [Brenneria sp. hezel4-2-4]
MQVQQQQQDSDRRFGLAREQFDHGKETDSRNFERQTNLDKEDARRFGLRQTLEQQQLGIQRAGLGMRAQELKMRKDEYNYKMNQEQRDQRLKDEMPAVKMLYDQLEKTGNIDPDLYKQISPDNSLHPKRFFGEKAIKNVMEINRIMPAVINGNMDYNDPAAIRAVNEVLSPHIQRGIGDKDPATGLTIKGKELAHIGLTEDGQRVIPTLKVTYSDGSAALKPMTRYGSSDPQDTIAPIPVTRLMDEVRGYGQMVGQLNHGGRAQFINNMVNPPDKAAVREEAKGLRKDLLDVGKARAKALADPLAQDPQAMAAINAQYDQLEQQVRESYGQVQPQSATQDPEFQMFAQQYQQQFGEAPDPNNPDDMAFFAQYKQSASGNKQQQVQQPAAQSGDSAIANQLRQMKDFNQR